MFFLIYQNIFLFLKSANQNNSKKIKIYIYIYIIKKLNFNQQSQDLYKLIKKKKTAQNTLSFFRLA
jgi:hypothetical protein